MISNEALTAIGTFAGGTGNLLEGLGFGGSNSDPGGTIEKQLRKQFKYQTDYDREGYYNKMLGAKKAGIHPIYALGTSSNFSPSASLPSPRGGRSLGQAGAGLAEMASALAKPKSDPTTQAMTQLGLRQAQAETLRSEYDTELKYMELERARQAENAPTPAPAAAAPKTPGVKSGPAQPLWIPVEDRDGRIIHILNPELGFEQSEIVSTIVQGVGLGTQPGPTNKSARPGPAPRMRQNRRHLQR